jgi:hypothetical protein
MRIEVVKRELNQGALAGFDSTVTDFAARLVIAAIDSYDTASRVREYHRGFQEGFAACLKIERQRRERERARE